MSFLQGANNHYNGATANCTDYVLYGIRSEFGGAPFNASEQLGDFSVTTPNAFYRLVSEFPDAQIYRTPGSEVSKDFEAALQLDQSDRAIASLWLAKEFNNRQSAQNTCPRKK